MNMFSNIPTSLRALIPIAALLCNLAGAQGSIENFETTIGFVPHIPAASSDGSVVVLGMRDMNPANSISSLWSANAGGLLDIASASGLFSTAYVSDCSADGSIAVGRGTTPIGTRAFRWTQSAGMQDLGAIGGPNDSRATSISADGSTIVGSLGLVGFHGFIWTSTGGMQDLGDTVRPTSCSADGSVVVGTMVVAGQENLFRWTGATGVQSLGFVLGMGGMGFPLVSADGAVITGASVGPAFTTQPYFWTASMGMQDLPGFPGGAIGFGTASGISADGSVIVGTNLDQNGLYRAYRWSVASGIQDLGDFGLTGGWPLVAIACSSDGSTVVGNAHDPATGFPYAFRWTAPGGMQPIDTLQGVGSRASLVSADGATVFGTAGQHGGVSPQQFFRWDAGSSGIGSTYGPSGLPNSTGGWGVISTSGSRKIVDNDLTLFAGQLPTNSFGIFLVGTIYTEFPLIGGGDGTLLVGGRLGRFNSGNEIQFSGSLGAFDLQLDLNGIPTPSGRVAVQPGETLFFQAWYRDLNPGPTSNLTNAVTITFL